jgi:hypothetical protein
MTDEFFPLLPPYSRTRSHIGAQGWSLSFLIFSEAVGLLGRVISSSQDLYLNIGQHKHRKTRTHITHPCTRRDSNPHSRPTRDRRLFMPQTARLPRPTDWWILNCKLFGRKWSWPNWGNIPAFAWWKKNRENLRIHGASSDVRTKRLPNTDL